MNRKELSKKLRLARIESGLKQEEIAELMNLPISGISVIEKGSRKVDVIELLKFAQYYNKPVEWFLYDKQDTNSRRWYDKARIKYQKSCACAIIGFLKESGLVK